MANSKSSTFEVMFTTHICKQLTDK